MAWRGARWIVFGVVALLAASYYRWEVQAAGVEFLWGKRNVWGYYDMLARSFAHGHLYLPVEPDPRLLLLADPTDAAQRQNIPTLWDAVLFHKHYYLYHGAGPAIMLFLPWRLLTHTDMPENYALYLFALGGFVFSALTLMELVRPKPWDLAVMLVALAFCQSIPFLLNRVLVYEVAIGGGYFCVAAGLFFFVRRWHLPAGLMFGLAVACRPHLAIVGIFAAAALAIVNRKRLLLFLAPVAVVAVSMAAYNYARFGSPLEFGLAHQITALHGEVNPRLGNVIYCLYYNLVCPPDFTRVFPFLNMPISPPHARHGEFFIEPIVGSLWLAPFFPIAAGVFLIEDLRRRIWFVPAAAGAILFFIATTGLITQRYEVDFLPLFVLSSMVVFAVLIERRPVVSLALVATVLFGVFVNAAMGIDGPYYDMVRHQPARYVKLAEWFSPAARLRPQLNPPFEIKFPVFVGHGPDFFRRDLFFAGQPPWRYDLYLRQRKGKLELVSGFRGEEVVSGIAFSDRPADLAAKYLPASGEMVISLDGSELLRQKIGTLVAAPAEIRAVRY